MYEFDVFTLTAVHDTLGLYLPFVGSFGCWTYQLALVISFLLQTQSWPRIGKCSFEGWRDHFSALILSKVAHVSLFPESRWHHEKNVCPCLNLLKVHTCSMYSIILATFGSFWINSFLDADSRKESKYGITLLQSLVLLYVMWFTVWK